MTDDGLEDARNAILAHALPDVPFDGWSGTTLARACTAAGLDPSMAARAFPGGPTELIAYWIADCDRRMLDAMAAQDLATLKLRQKVALAVRLRLEPLAGHKEAVRAALGHLALPLAAPAALKSLHRTVDAIWQAVGDRSTDFSYYTKRMMLAGVYSSTLLYWLDDKSEGNAATWDFLDRRIDNIMQITKLRGRLDKLVDRLPWGLNKAFN